MPGGPTFRATSDPGAACPEPIAFLADHGVPPALLRAAGREAKAAAVDPARQAIAAGFVTEEDFCRAAAAELGLRFEAGPVALIDAVDVAHAVRSGIARIRRPDGRICLALAPDGASLSALRLAGLAGRTDLVVISPTRLAEAARRRRASEIATAAAWLDPAGARRPSARDGPTRRQSLTALAILLFASAPFLWDAAVAGAVLGAVFALPCFALILLRLAPVFEPALVAVTATRAVRPAELPVYTVCLPVYGEEAVLTRLLAALVALDYPPAKLDVKLILEEGDAGMRAAVARTALPAFVSVILAPDGRPRTKPRALNIALAEARGELLTIYDAEDEPDPAQLRLAAAAFSAAGPDLACLQARLVIDNCGDGWLQRLFALEYCGLFDVLNPGLIRSGLPILLGGTSNHFRISALHAVGGWDAWNVTEDADMSIRLIRRGYRVGDLPSHTLEEAPPSLRIWLRQRTRWMKGYLQTVVVHTRSPSALFAEAGWEAALGFLTVTLGTLMSALGYPLFILATVLIATTGDLLRPDGALAAVGSSIGLAVILCGLAAIMLPPALGAWRRGALWLWPALPLLPLYYLLVSFASWRAMVEFVRAPHHWHKTAHGFSRTSRYRGTNGSHRLVLRDEPSAPVSLRPSPTG